VIQRVIKVGAKRHVQVASALLGGVPGKIEIAGEDLGAGNIR